MNVDYVDNFVSCLFLLAFHAFLAVDFVSTRVSQMFTSTSPLAFLYTRHVFFYMLST